MAIIHFHLIYEFGLSPFSLNLWIDGNFTHIFQLPSNLFQPVGLFWGALHKNLEKVCGFLGLDIFWLLGWLKGNILE